MTQRLFGTDGIRGTANTYPMTAETALKLGMAAGLEFVRGDHRHRVVIGKDTRLSGYMIEPALTAGFIAAGMDVTLVGPMPTPAIGFLTRSLRADIGVMISASHNPYHDNGIKLFGPHGFKLSDDIERKIEARMARSLEPELARPDMLGRAQRLEGAYGRYIEYLKSSFPRNVSLAGLKVAVDSANGAAYAIAPRVFWELGAEVIEVGNEPNGFNINQGCGSTDTTLIRKTVLRNGADIGVAVDGDADRVVLVDEKGNMIDGDQLLALIASSWNAHGRLSGGGIVATQMSNFGLETFLAKLGLALHRTQVGDRYVVEKMRAAGFNLGGEQSGHIVMTDFATTGDGLLAALQVLAVVLEKGRPASEVCRPFTPVPQRMRNIRMADGLELERKDVRSAIDNGSRLLEGHGRLLVRRSGTEPVIRVMVEAEDEHLLSKVLDSVGNAIEESARQPAM